MKNTIILFIGAVMTAGFTSLFYALQNSAPTPPASAEVSKAAPEQPAQIAPDPLNIHKTIGNAKIEIAKIDDRTKVIEAEKKDLVEKKTVLKKTVTDNQDLLQVIGDIKSYPTDDDSRKTLLGLASAIVSVRDPGERPFATINGSAEKTSLYIEARRLFGHVDPTLLRVSQTNKLASIIDALPKGLKLKTVTIYQSAESSDSISATRLKSLEQYLQETYGSGVDEILVRLTKKSTIPDRSEFLLELNLGRDDGHDVNSAEAQPAGVSNRRS